MTWLLLLHSTVQYSTIQYKQTVQYSTVQYSTVQYSTDTVQTNSTVQYSLESVYCDLVAVAVGVELGRDGGWDVVTVDWCGKPESPRAFCTRFLLYCTVLYCTVLYCTVLYWTSLYCTVLVTLQERWRIPGKSKNPKQPRGRERTHRYCTRGRDVTWRDVTWRDVTWRDVTWRDVTCKFPCTLLDWLRNITNVRQEKPRPFTKYFWIFSDFRNSPNIDFISICLSMCHWQTFVCHVSVTGETCFPLCAALPKISNRSENIFWKLLA